MKIRQVAPDISGIRDDHVNRYQFAIDTMREKSIVGHIMDVGCGVGYGCKMMADQCDAIVILGIDPSLEAIAYAFKHYASEKVAFVVSSMESSNPMGFEVLTMFEVIEHSDRAPVFLRQASGYVKYLFGSVPNENVVPFKKGGYNTEHYRHYTPGEIQEELKAAGWSVTSMGSQIGKRGPTADVTIGNMKGRTIVFFAESAP